MEVDTLAVVMLLGVTFTEAHAWLHNTEQANTATVAEHLSIWFWQQRQRMLGEELAVYRARTRLMDAILAAIGAQEVQEQQSKEQRTEDARGNVSRHSKMLGHRCPQSRANGWMHSQRRGSQAQCPVQRSRGTCGYCHPI